MVRAGAGFWAAGAQPPERPTLFFKPSTAVNNPGDPIVFPPELTYINHEGEIGIVIGRLARRVKRERASDYILGYTCVNDVTAGELRKTVGTPMMFHAKSFDTFAPFGPVIATDIDPSNLDTECRVNGEVRVKARTDDLDILAGFSGQLDLAHHDAFARRRYFDRGAGRGSFKAG